jgi:hypothetical protein
MPVNISIKPSRSFALLLALASLLTLWSIWSTNLAVLGRLVLTAIVLAAFLYHFERWVLLHGQHAWLSCRLDKNSLVVKTRNGEEWLAEVLPETIVTPYFVLLRAKVEQGGVISQAIFWDALRDDVFRELRVRLRFS